MGPSGLGGSGLGDSTPSEGIQAPAHDDEPLYVNAKQYFRILKRRVARARLEELHRLSRQRKVSVLFIAWHSLYILVLRSIFNLRPARYVRAFVSSYMPYHTIYTLPYIPTPSILFSPLFSYLPVSNIISQCLNTHANTSLALPPRIPPQTRHAPPPWPRRPLPHRRGDRRPAPRGPKLRCRAVWGR